MASQINVITSVENIFKQFFSLKFKNDFFYYIEVKEIGVRNYIEINDKTKIDSIINDNYSGFFITSIPFEKQKHKSFFDDEFCKYAIEGTGGRITSDDIEKISLRIISKNPDKNIKSFLASLQKWFPLNNDFSKGIEHSCTALYKNTFYNKELCKNRKAWFDFKRRITPIALS